MKKGKSMCFWLLLLFFAVQVRAQSLPMQWSHAEANYTNGANTIKWTTAYESGCKEFTVEKSINGSTWQTIASPIAARNVTGPNYYEIKDPSESSSVTWYRIRRTDNDGKTAHSVTLIAQKGKGIVVQLFSYPTPAEF